jgi:hypothetical protein
MVVSVNCGNNHLVSSETKTFYNRTKPMSMSELAKRIATSSGVINVGGKRVVYHALNYKSGLSVSDRTLIKEMVFEDGVLYVASTVIGVEMPFSKQQDAMAKMANFVRPLLKD